MRVNSISSVRVALGFDQPMFNRVAPRVEKKKLYQIRVNFGGDIICYAAELNHAMDGIGNAMERFRINPESMCSGKFSISVRPTLRRLSC